jgi:glucose/arabinose dehydrogenase
MPPASLSPAPVSLRQIVSGLQRPVYLTQPPDGTNRLFIVEQQGLILIVQDGQLLPDPFLDLGDRVNSTGNEEGLLGLAFHPQYRQNGRFFVDYTDVHGNANIVRFTASPSNPDRADLATATTILQIGHPNFQNHNGGDLVFGPDGYLYFGMGDGGSQGDPNGHGQNLNILLGKLLRIDVNAEPYGIPPDNPFLGRANARPEIWAYGLRNPWRFSFDRATGDLYIADVGQDLYEEVDYQPAGSHGGENYGWSYMEGFHPYKGSPPPGITLTAPVTEYSHAEGGCAIVGGYVYRGTTVPQLKGVYLFGDNCSGIVWTLARTSAGWQKALLLRTGLSISSFGEDQAGELYVLDLAGGVVYQWISAPQGQ